MSEPASSSTADEIFSVLRTVHTAFARHGIWHCLLFGTLLGAVRDGDVIAWDHDLDLLVRPVDVPRILALNDELAVHDVRFGAARLPAARLAANPGGAAWFDPAHLDILRSYGGCGELYAPTLFDDGVLRLYDFEHEIVHWPQSSFPAFAVEDLDTAPVRGWPFPVPRHAERLLEWHYGPDWRTPQRSEIDGGPAREDRTPHGDVAEPDLERRVRWCREQGWDTGRYRGQPRWPRPLAGAGPAEGSLRTRLTSGSAWWHTLDEVTRYY